MTDRDIKIASFICCPMCDKEKCVGRFKCDEIKNFIEKRGQSDDR